jgi:hypothetical protein
MKQKTKQKHTKKQKTKINTNYFLAQFVHPGFIKVQRF